MRAFPREAFLSLLATALASGGVPDLVAQSVSGVPQEVRQELRERTAERETFAAAGGWISATATPETEPNDTTTTAESIALGDTISAVIGAPGDIDIFSVAVDSGEVLDFQISLPSGSTLPPLLALIGPDSTTQLWPIPGVVNGGDTRIVYDIAQTGTYFLGVRANDLSGASTHTYLMTADLFPLTAPEPNDVAAQAIPTTLVDTVFGVINPNSDVDYYSLDLPGGIMLEIDSDAFDIGSLLLASLRVLAPDGITPIARSGNALNAMARVFIPEAGTYFVEITDTDGLGFNTFFYRMHFGLGDVGPGDPTTLFASGVGLPVAMSAAGDGRLFVLDRPGGKVYQVDPSGSSTEIINGIAGAEDLVLDGRGRLLIGSFGGGVPRVRSFTPGGGESEFTTDLARPGPMTVDSRGNIWIADLDSRRIVRFSPDGEREDSVSIANTELEVYDMAFSPSGELHFTTRSEKVYRVSGGVAVPVLTLNEVLEGIAFDEDGFLYVASGFPVAKVFLFSPSYQEVEDPFAVSNLGGPLHVAFLRDTDGNLTRRLVVSNTDFGLVPPWNRSIVEVDSSAVRAPGFRIGIDLLEVTVTELAPATVGVEYRDSIPVVTPPVEVVWRLTQGSLPPGLSLDSMTGVVSGLPESDGLFPLTVEILGEGVFAEFSHEMQVSRPSLASGDAVDAILGVPGVLTPELELFLDLQGNRNGFFDVGDLRAFLRAEGQLQGAAAAGRQADR